MARVSKKELERYFVGQGVLALVLVIGFVLWVALVQGQWLPFLSFLAAAAFVALAVGVLVVAQRVAARRSSEQSYRIRIERIKTQLRATEQPYELRDLYQLGQTYAGLFGITHSPADRQAALKYMRKAQESDPEKFGVVVASMGGFGTLEADPDFECFGCERGDQDPRAPRASRPQEDTFWGRT